MQQDYFPEYSVVYFIQKNGYNGGIFMEGIKDGDSFCKTGRSTAA